MANFDQTGVWVCKAKTESRNIFFENIQLLINKFNKKNEFKVMKQNGWLTFNQTGV